jgi:hypothetical protein
MAKKDKRFSTVPLNWKEVYYTNCPLVSASNIDQQLGWTKEEFKKIGVQYAFLRSRQENNWYPHYIHNLDNLIRFGGLFPPIHVHADIRRTRLLEATWVYEGGCMLVCCRPRDSNQRREASPGGRSWRSESSELTPARSNQRMVLSAEQKPSSALFDSKGGCCE